jgi:hypothetical protein
MGAAQPIRDAVPSWARLDCCADRRAALRGAYLLGDRGCNPVFLISGAKAGPGSASEPTKSAMVGPRGNPREAAARRSSVLGRADAGRRSAARLCA